MNILNEAIESLKRQIAERIADDASTPCLLSFERAQAVLIALADTGEGGGKQMTEKRVEHTVSIGNVFDTFDEAVEFRKKVKNPHLYGVYGMWQSENKQLWVVVPMVALEALSNFRDQS